MTNDDMAEKLMHDILQRLGRALFNYSEIVSTLEEASIFLNMSIEYSALVAIYSERDAQVPEDLAVDLVESAHILMHELKRGVVSERSESRTYARQFVRRLDALS